MTATPGIWSAWWLHSDEPGVIWPETGEIEGAPPRINTVEIAEFDRDYAPVSGLTELREAVAAMYNRLYRKGMPSQYTAENVAISSGGRAALTRAAASIGTVCCIIAQASAQRW